MSLLNEGSESGLEQSLDQGLLQLSRNQTLEFSQYVKQVVSQDGYVFWVATGQVMQAEGSLHYGTELVQEEDQTIGVNAVIFTAMQEIKSFNEVASNTLWVADWTTPEGVTIKIAFSRRGPFYQQANLHHYSGFAVYPALAAQLINTAADLPVGPIVSNSLPIWMGQNSVAPVYPSFLVSENALPPYIVAHIDPMTTDAVGAFPIYQWPGNPTPLTALQSMASSQLLKDKVRLTLYGFNSQQATQYYVSLIEYSLNTDAFGFMNSPVIRDEKRTQSEITAIAMKKTIEIDASYYLNTADVIARRLILSASVSIN